MAIPHTLEYESQVMTVVVEGRRPQCWNCKQLGNFSISCPQKTTKTTSPPLTTTTTASITTTASVTTVTIPPKSGSPKGETGDHPNKEEGWTKVTRGWGKKSSLKTPTVTTTPENEPPTTVKESSPSSLRTIGYCRTILTFS